MAYVEAHASLKSHPKTKKAARLLDIPKTQMIGHLLCLWWWCQEYAEDGDLTDHDIADIAEAAEWEGDPGEFIAALTDCGLRGSAGFLRRDVDGSLTVNDWMEYGGKYNVKKAQSRERMRNKRQADNDVTRNLRVTCADVTHIDKIREDKRREDHSNSDELLPPEQPEQPAEKLTPAKKTRTATEPTAQQAMFQALAEVTLLDAKLKAKQLGKTASELLKAEYTPEHVKRFGEWWATSDWRGQKGAAPTLAQVMELIKQANTPRAHINGTPAPAPVIVSGIGGLFNGDERTEG